MLVVELADRDSVVINNTNPFRRRVFGKRLLSSTEKLFLSNLTKAEEMYELGREDTKPNKFVFVVIRKTLLNPRFIENDSSYEKKGIWGVEIFAYSFDRELLSFFPGAWWKSMKGYEIANSLFEVHTLFQTRTLKGLEEIEEFQLEQPREGLERIKSQLKDRFGFLTHTPLSILYSELASQILQHAPYRVYTSVRYVREEIDWHKLISLPWRGSLWLLLNLSNLEPFLMERSKIPVAEVGKYYKELLELYRKGEKMLLGGAVLVTPDPLPDAVKGELFSLLGYSAIETTQYRRAYILETPLKFVVDTHLLLHTPRG